jgi:hypothetical protein
VGTPPAGSPGPPAEDGAGEVLGDSGARLALGIRRAATPRRTPRAADRWDDRCRGRRRANRRLLRGARDGRSTPRPPARRPTRHHRCRAAGPWLRRVECPRRVWRSSRAPIPATSARRVPLLRRKHERGSALRRRAVAGSRPRHRHATADLLHGSRDPRLCSGHAGGPSRRNSWACGARRDSRRGRRVLALLRAKVDALTDVGDPDARRGRSVGSSPWWAGLPTVKDSGHGSRSYVC